MNDIHPILLPILRTASHAWLEHTNPLQGLSIQSATAIYDTARLGNYSRLQYIFNEIEKVNPVLMTCVERRTSALAGLGWRISAPSANSDPKLAEEQKNKISEMVSSLDNLEETIEHLGLAFFRGFSHARILRNPDGTPTGFDILNSWNFVFDKGERQWYWNPECALGLPGSAEVFDRVPKGELVSVVRPRCIDWPALAIHIRHALAERSWGRFLERYGIPPVNVIMPTGASLEDKRLFLDSTAKLQKGGMGGSWPQGTQISYAGEARGVNPFLPFIEHQEKLIVLLSTGGTLTSLAQSGTGTLAGNAQMDVWEEIVKRDAAIIGNVIDREVVQPYLKLQFPNQPILAHFELGHESELAPGELFEIAGKARAAGYRIAKSELEGKTGYTLEEDAVSTPMVSPGESPALNAAKNTKREHEPEEKKPADTDSLSILQAFAKDATPAAQAVKALIDNPNPAEAEKLLKNLPDLLPRDPAMAAVIAEEMAKAFQLAPDAALNREYKRARDGKFSEVDEPRDLNPGINPDDSTVQAAQIGKGKKALAKCLAEKCDIHDAVMRSDIGGISFRFGDEKSGIKHFFDRKEALAKLPETLIRGEAGKPYQGGQKLNITHGGFVATLALTNDPTKGERPPTWVLTSFGPKDKKEGTSK